MTDPPGTLRPIPDPQAEMERLALVRKQRTPDGDYLLIDSSYIAERQAVPGEFDHTCWVRVRVTSEHPRVLPEGLDRKLMDVLRENWPATETGNA